MESENNGTENEKVKYVAAECDNCSKRLKLKGWREGIKCPKCNAGNLAPFLADGGAVDYCLADRSSGYSQHDIRFAQWAKWTELITPRQYEQAFLNQNKLDGKSGQILPIHKIMIKQGWISEKQAVGLLEFMCRERPDQDDSDFADAVLKSGLAGTDTLREAQKIQQDIAVKANETPPLCQVILEKRILNENRTVTLLKHLKDRGIGPLLSAVETVKGPAKVRKKKDRGDIKKLAAGNLREAGLILGLFLLAAGIWAWQAYDPPQMVMVVCESCDEVSELQWTTGFPLKCPECSRQSAYAARICREGHVFPAKNPFAPQACPVCGTREVTALGSHEDLKDN